MNGTIFLKLDFNYQTFDTYQINSNFMNQFINLNDHILLNN